MEIVMKFIFLTTDFFTDHSYLKEIEIKENYHKELRIIDMAREESAYTHQIED